MGSGFSKKKKQMKQFQEQMAQMQTNLVNSEEVGIAGNGLVSVTLSGNGDLKSITIKPECVDPEDVDGLQDLIKAAHKQAHDKIEAQSAQATKGIPGLPSGFPDLKSFGL